MVRLPLLVLLVSLTVSCTSGARPSPTLAPQTHEDANRDSLSSAELDSLLISTVTRELCRQLRESGLPLVLDSSGDTLMVLKLRPRKPMLSDPCRVRSRKPRARVA